MKLGHHTALAQHSLRPVLAGLGMLWFGSACSAQASDAAPLEQLEQGLQGGKAPASQQASGGTARGRHGRGRHHHRGHGGGAGGGGAVAAPCGPSDPDELFQLINADLAGVDGADLPFQRYVSLSDRSRSIGCGAALGVERDAIVKMFNSVSISASASQLVAIDADLTVFRVDLRDFDWDRPIAVGGRPFPDAWEALVASSPYAVPFVGDDADDAVSDTGTRVPVLFGSAFVAAAASAPLYYALLDIPSDLNDFLANDLAIDVAQDRLDEDTVRAGFVAPARGGNSEFLAERFDIEVRAGYVWQISKFSNALGDLFDDPLGNATGEREVIFTLPNGLQGHIVADGNGRVKASSNLLLDASESDGLAHVATSFFASRAQGVQLEDEVRPFVQANPRRFNAAERAAIFDVYPAAADLQGILDSDNAGFFGRGLQLIDLDIASSPEPISASFADFSQDVDLETAAGELYVTPQELQDNIALLDPVMSVLAGGGRIDRQDFDTLYTGSLCILSVVLENQVDPATCDAALAP